MKTTYVAPTVTDRGDVVRTTLSGKQNLGVETGMLRGPTFGSSLSFGL